jgi:hypothetical protein
VRVERSPGFSDVFVIVDGCRRVHPVFLQGRSPPPAWGAPLFWALTPLTIAVDVATCWLQPPIFFIIAATVGIAG